MVSPEHKNNLALSKSFARKMITILMGVRIYPLSGADMETDRILLTVIATLNGQIVSLVISLRWTENSHDNDD